MTAVIKLKRGTTTPTTGDITSGEVAIDTSAQKFYINDSGTIKSIGDTSLSDLSITSTAAELNHLDGVTGITLGTANELLIVGSDGTSIISDSTLSIDTGSNYIGINQSSPEVTLHMTGEGAQTAQIRMEQYNDSADAPDLRTRRYRGTIASPSAVSSGDYLYRSNHEYWNGSALIVGGSFAFDNTNNANRTQFAVSVNTDGTSADPNNASKTQFKIDGNDSGAITFNNAYKFPTSDGSASQVLQTDGSGTLSFATVSGGGSDITVQDEGSSLATAATTLNFVGNGVTATGSGSTKTITVTQATLSDLSVTATSTELNLLDGITAIADEDDMTSNSDTSLATQQSIKAYVDSQSVDLSSIGESLLPDVTETRDLGSASKRWRDLYLSGNTINLNGATISSDGTGSITISATGAVLPENSKVSVASGVEKEFALAGADGSPVQSVPFFSKAGGLNSQNTKLDFKADPDKVVAAFTLANGSQLGSSLGNTLFFF
ncbi:hypothetical protein N9C63_00395 [bacterium]|nr:hypothetical protein [bacterium]